MNLNGAHNIKQPDTGSRGDAGAYKEGESWKEFYEVGDGEGLKARVGQ